MTHLPDSFRNRESDSMGNENREELIRIADQLKRAHDGTAWHGPSLSEILQDVDAGMASKRLFSKGHTIWEIVLHITAWEKAVLESLSGSPLDLKDQEDWPAPQDGKPEAWKKLLEELGTNHRNLQVALSGLQDSVLQKEVEQSEYNLYTLLHGVIQHTLFHAGQVSMLRRALQNS